MGDRRSEGSETTKVGTQAELALAKSARNRIQRLSREGKVSHHANAQKLLIPYLVDPAVIG